MRFHLNGVHLPHRKSTSAEKAVRMESPKSVTLPMSMHIGNPAIPAVKIGNEVKIGTLIATQNGVISSPIHASVSGKVTKISDMLLSNGSKVPAITIESDGAMNVDENLIAPVINSKEDFVEALKNSGIVGLGGAGFPTYVKFNVSSEKIEELIINGAECEPYITSDSYTMLNRVEDIKFAIEKIQELFSVKRIIIGIENNKKSCIDSMKELAKGNNSIEVKVLPSIYPQGGEKVLVYHTTGKKIPQGKLPIDVGCIVCNCTTIASIGSYLKTGIPLVEKCVTVAGGAVKKPQNVIVPIGTSLSDVFDTCGGLISEPEKILYGGPMMGISVPDTSVPILKNTNAILALTKRETKTPKHTACIRCGACANICPFGINPAAMARAYEKKEYEQLPDLGAELCMECGCCSYVCPANRPLVQLNKLAKIAVKEEKLKEAQKQ